MNSAWEMFGDKLRAARVQPGRQDDGGIFTQAQADAANKKQDESPRVQEAINYYSDLDRAWDEAHEETGFTEVPLWDDVNQVWATGRVIGGMFTGGYWAKKVIIHGAYSVLALSERLKTDEQRISEGPQ